MIKYIIIILMLLTTNASANQYICSNAFNELMTVDSSRCNGCADCGYEGINIYKFKFGIFITGKNSKYQKQIKAALIFMETLKKEIDDEEHKAEDNKDSTEKSRHKESKD